MATETEIDDDRLQATWRHADTSAGQRRRLHSVSRPVLRVTRTLWPVRPARGPVVAPAHKPSQPLNIYHHLESSLLRCTRAVLLLQSPGGAYSRHITCHIAVSAVRATQAITEAITPQTSKGHKGDVLRSKSALVNEVYVCVIQP